jgi:Icc-related predicted phosphoesterase
LEFGLIKAPSTKADVIIAAGDIGIHKQGIEWLKSFDRPVIYVAGNHEFYNNEINSTIDEFRHECADSQVHYLENNKVIYQGVRFLGCTLWADLYVEGEEKAEKLAETLNDFNRINFQDNFITPTQYSKQFHRSRKWLANELSKPFIGKTVVVTHHAPSQWSWNKSPNEITRLAYCNDLKSLIYQYKVNAWFHGHIHSVADYRIAETQIFCNPRGYSGRSLVEGFDLNRSVVI